MIRMQHNVNWKEALEPQAELIGQLIKPEIYKQYRSMKEQMEKKKKAGEPLDVSYQDGKTRVSHAVADTRYDDNLGLIDANGNVLIPKEKYKEMLENFSGAAISL